MHTKPYLRWLLLSYATIGIVLCDIVSCRRSMGEFSGGRDPAHRGRQAWPCGSGAENAHL